MYCTICNHSWCWTCGYSTNHWFHSILFGGMFCQILNTFSFGFECGGKLHWTIRFLLTLIAAACAPVIFIGMSFFMYIYYVVLEEYSNFNLFLCIEPPRNKWGFWLMYAPALTIQFFVLWAVWMAGAVVVLCLCVVPFYICLIMVFLRICFRFCFKKKFKETTKDQLEYQEKFFQRNQKVKEVQKSALDRVKLLSIIKEEIDEESLVKKPSQPR